MLGLFGTLDMAARSLSVQQEATQVTGQNVANANNPAYARQTLVVQSSTPLQTPIGQEGTGVQSVSINEIRNSILDNQIQSEASVTGSLTAQQSGLQQAEAFLGEQLSTQTPNGSATSAAGSYASLSAGLSSLFSAFQNLSNNPGDLSTRQGAIAAGQQLAAQFNQVSSQLNLVQTGLNQSIQSDVSSANQNLAAIAALNQQIVQAKASGGTANTLVDQRQQLIETLAGTANLTLTNDANGAIDIAVGGTTMVSGQNVFDTLQAVDPGNGNFTIQDSAGGKPLALTGGSIEGELTARDGALATLQSGVNSVASQLITNVNQIYSAGFDLKGNTGQNFFTGTDAASIGVNANLLTDASQFQAAGVAGAPGDNSVALSLAQLGNQGIAALNNQSFSQSYSQSVAELGNSINSVNDQLANSQAAANMLSSQRATQSGVNIDEEMTNLLEFQKAYEASAKLISTVDEMLQTVVTMKST